MEPEPTAIVSKPVLDPLNTLAWFAMDACWLAKLPWPAYLLAGLAVLTGGLLVVLGRRDGRGELFAVLGLNCWIVMNTVWMAHDLNGREVPGAFVAVVAPLGAGFILLAARHSVSVRRLRALPRRAVSRP